MEVDGSDSDGAPAAPASGSSGADALHIPPVEAVAIEFPGYIRNPERALEALGGAAGAAAALDARAAVLKLWLRPWDPLSHPLYGERRRARSLLLRVSRPRPPAPGSTPTGGDSTGGDGAPGTSSAAEPSQPAAAVAIAAAAVVRASYRFNGLADYQYLPVDPRTATRGFSTLPEKNRPDMAEAYKAPQPFLLVPPLFSRTDVPLDFPFVDGDAAGGAPPAALFASRCVLDVAWLAQHELRMQMVV